MPRHVNPVSDDRTALAPYNFVPLPNAVLTVADGIKVGDTTAQPWHCQDRYLPGTHSGWIDLSLTTKTPLFIRSAVPHPPGDERDSRLRPEPFTVPDPEHPGQRLPAIPGSSLRGAVRTLVEILSFAKIAPVSEQKPFYRTVGNERLGEEYRRRMVRGNIKPSGGFLRHDHGQWWIAPAEALRVSHDVLRQATIGFFYENKPNYLPSVTNKNLQHARCWVRRGEKPWQCDAIVMAAPAADGWIEGRLVLTGSAPKKKAEFVFLAADDTRRFPVPEALAKRFLDDDQITNWQEKNFPKGARPADGHLCENEPVFYLLDESLKAPDNLGGLVFFGRAQMFRLPYDLRPSDLVPKKLCGDFLDLAEALFGYVRREAGDAQVALGGRVSFDDAIAVRGGPDWYEPRFVPHILASPKPTAFSQYLTQDGRVPPDALTTYLHGDETQIRGHKLYWHRWDAVRGLTEVRQGPDKLVNLERLAGLAPGRAEPDTQSTLIRPVKGGVEFKGRVRFDNLADIELGALLEALQLPAGCAHKIGMAKPLGLGSVRIETQVTFVDRQVRYAGWNASGRRSDDTRVKRCRQAFVETIRVHARGSDETLVPGSSGLLEIARLDVLYRLLDWEHRPSFEDTRYLKVKGGDEARFGTSTRGNEFKHRPVLPTPHAVQEAAEPSWTPDPPRAGTAPAAPTSHPQAPAHASSPPPRPRPTVHTGETVECEVLAEKTRKGGLRFRVLADGKTGVLHPTSPSPGELQPGERVRLMVKTTGAEYMLQWPGQPAAPERDSSS